nr:avidin [Columba livia]
MAASLAPAVPTGLQLQPYKGGQAGHRAGREPCWTVHSSIAMGSSAFTLVLVLALVTCVTPAERKCQLSGLWRNEQDSLMEISAVRDNGDFQGKYLTRVTVTGSCAYTSPLKGAQQQPTDGVWPTFAFTVHWDKFSNATTAFTGQCFVDTGGKETLTTMWLLREAVGSLEEDWKATRVGRNVFTRKRTSKGKTLLSLSQSCEHAASPTP